VRGEKALLAIAAAVYAGSSPRAWGKVRAARPAARNGRIIPTCVGKRRVQDMVNAGDADHPHVRGEKTYDSTRLPVERGSSPRAWGKECHL